MSSMDKASRALDSQQPVPVDYSQRAKLWHDLGIRSRDLYRRKGQIVDLEQSIRYHQQSLEASPADSRAECLKYLGARFRDLFKKTGQMADLDQSIQYQQQELEVRSADGLAECLNNLGIGFSHRYEKTAQIADLEQAIKYSQQALETAPLDDPNRIIYLRNHGIGLADRFQESSQIEDLNQAIQCYQQALEVMPIEHSGHAACCGSLGAALADRFRITGQMADLDQSIQYTHQAFEATPVDDPEYITHLSNLGTGFGERFRRIGQMTDLEQSIQYYEQAIEATPPHDPTYARTLSFLGTEFRDRWGKTDQMADLERSIQCHQQALTVMPADHQDYKACLGHLGLDLTFRYHRTGQIADLERSIQYTRQAVEATPADHLDRGGSLAVLANGLMERFERGEEIIDIDQSIKYAQQAVEALLPDHPQRSRVLIILGVAFAKRSKRTASSADFNNSTEAFRTVVSSSSGFPSIRITAGLYAVDNYIEGYNWKEAAGTLDEILQLLPEVAIPTNSRDDIQSTLRQLSNLASASASIFLKAGRSSLEALQALERARGIIAGLMIDARSDISILKEKHPELWSRYTDCQQQILTSSEASFALHNDSQENYMARTIRRQQLLDTLNDLRNEIRRCPGFERFLLSPTEREIRDMAREGPLVCFNVSEISSEAFLVLSTGIQVIPLPNLKLEDVRSQLKLFTSRGNSPRRDATLYESDEDETYSSPDILTELRSIWDNAVKPVLLQARMLNHTVDTLPRIYWVGGIMALLPLHAAGDHTRGSLENTLSHAISSFAPTLKTLQFTQNKPPFSILEQRPEILIVSMPSTPGEHTPLNVAEEVAAIAKYSGTAASIRHLSRPTRGDVLSALKSCTIAHFACHGSADRIEPSKSALIVGRETEERLTVEDLDTIIYSGAKIAYLSACSTAEIQVYDLVEESVHLASIFQLAGFQHVIGTLWEADDTAAIKIASKFYEGLLQHGEVRDNSVAQALHDAVLCFRNAGDNHTAISLWAPFIHLGY